MANNYLITGYWGEPHVTAENDRGINAGIFGTGRFVLPVGQQFKAEYIGNNTVRLYDGKLLDNGAAAGIPAGKYIDLLIPETGQGMKRNDLIVFQYSQDSSTMIESGEFVVIQGMETAGTAVDPELTQEDLLTDEASFDQMALWRVPVSGASISDPIQLFDVSKNLKNAGAAVVEATSNDGVAYSATVPGVTELSPGLEVTIIPKKESASTAITLDINGLGAKMVRLPLSTNTAILVQPSQASFFVDNRPVKLIYDDKYASKGAWVVVGRQRPSGNDMYGSVPVQSGGIVIDNNTTEEDKTEALENLNALGALSKELLWENDSPQSAFASRKITMDFSGYSQIEIEFIRYRGQDGRIFRKARIDQTGYAEIIEPFQNVAYIFSRNFKFTQSSIEFDSGYTSTATSAVVDNERMIPFRIYGIKGVS